MMSSVMDDDDWGRRRLAARQRRRGAIRAIMVLAGLAFAFGAPLIVPVGSAADGATLMLGLGYMAIVAIGGWFAWREADEIELGLATSAFAAVGLTCLFLLPIARVAAPLLGIANPPMAILIASLAAAASTYLVRRLRG